MVIDEFRFDVFLSHANEDKPTVTKLAKRLESDGFQVWFDEDAIPYGALIPDAIEDGLKGSRLLMHFVSAASAKSSYANYERLIAQFRDVTNKEKRFVPVLLDDCEVSETLSVFKLIDWRKRCEEGYRSMVEAITNAKPPGHVVVGDRVKQLAIDRFDQPITVRIRGGKPLAGEVTVRGAKNSAPKQMIASLLTNETCVLENVPNVRDVAIVSEMIRSIGGVVEEIASGTLQISTAKIDIGQLYQLDNFADLSRMPILFLAPLLHRFGKANIPALGGCELNGARGRPVNFHLDALSQMGVLAKEMSDGSVIASCEASLRPARIHLPGPSVGATEQVLLAAAMTDGTTYLSNASVEPEVLDLIGTLRMMGANISIDEVRKITIHGTSNLKSYDHAATTDRSEIGSWAAAAAATRGCVSVRNANVDGLETLIEAFSRMGGVVEEFPGGLRFDATGGELRAIDLETGPQFKTDWQPAFAVALTQASGKSVIHETVFSDRFGYTSALNNMQADIEVLDHCPSSSMCGFSNKARNHTAVIRGKSKLTPGEVTINELRGGFASVVAALVADGESVIRNFQWLEKGYENVATKLTDLGADVEMN